MTLLMPTLLIRLLYKLREIKPCKLGSRIWGMEAESHNWYHFLVCQSLVSRNGAEGWGAGGGGAEGWTERWVKMPR